MRNSRAASPAATRLCKPPEESTTAGALAMTCSETHARPITLSALQGAVLNVLGGARFQRDGAVLVWESGEVAVGRRWAARSAAANSGESRATRSKWPS